MHQLIMVFKYLWHLLHAKSAMRIHSPFIYHFYWDIVLGKGFGRCDATLGQYIQSLREDQSMIDIDSGGLDALTRAVKISSLQAQSRIRRQEASLLFRLAKTKHPSIIYDLGTTLGVTTAALALGAPHAQVHSIDTDPGIIGLIRERLTFSGIQNVHYHTGSYLELLPDIFLEYGRPDIVFLHSDHRKGAILDVAERILPVMQQHGVFIVHGIHDSKGMQENWALMKCLPEVTASVDLFFMGLLFVSDELSSQHFRLLW